MLIYNIGWDAAACLSWASLQVSLTPSLEGGGKEALGSKGRPPKQMDIRETGLNRLLIPLYPAVDKTSARPGNRRG